VLSGARVDSPETRGLSFLYPTRMNVIFRDTPGITLGSGEGWLWPDSWSALVLARAILSGGGFLPVS
jgi:hypothetical protein